MIQIVDYNPEWKIQFRDLEHVFLDVLQDLIITVEHVGSTSVPGLKAKPILDIDIIIPENLLTWSSVKAHLEQLGYHHVGDYGIAGREVFKSATDQVPKDGSKRTWPKHHLYVCPANIYALKNHLTLRNYLRNNPQAVQEYGRIKTRLAKQFPHDIDAYIHGKTDFITRILEKEGLEREVIEKIRLQNRM